MKEEEKEGRKEGEKEGREKQKRENDGGFKLYNIPIKCNELN